MTTAAPLTSTTTVPFGPTRQPSACIRELAMVSLLLKSRTAANAEGAVTRPSATSIAVVSNAQWLTLPVARAEEPWNVASSDATCI
ncbi:hypothetical protein ACFQS6_05050 [Xanthomonas populi]